MNNIISKIIKLEKLEPNSEIPEDLISYYLSFLFENCPAEAVYYINNKEYNISPRIEEINDYLSYLVFEYKIFKQKPILTFTFAKFLYNYFYFETEKYFRIFLEIGCDHCFLIFAALEFKLQNVFDFIIENFNETSRIDHKEFKKWSEKNIKKFLSKTKYKQYYLDNLPLEILKFVWPILLKGFVIIRPRLYENFPLYKENFDEYTEKRIFSNKLTNVENIDSSRYIPHNTPVYHCLLFIESVKYKIKNYKNVPFWIFLLCLKKNKKIKHYLNINTKKYIFKFFQNYSPPQNVLTKKAAFQYNLIRYIKKTHKLKSTIVINSIRYNNFYCFEYFLKNCKLSKRFLDKACYYGRVKMVKHLLSAGLVPDPKHFEIAIKYPKTFRILFENKV